jgi:hypothetical protein
MSKDEWSEKVARAVDGLDAIKPGGPEANHLKADAILLEFVPEEVRQAFDRAESRDGGWWWA